MAGKGQILNVDPPYHGIRFASSFQPKISRRDVKDKRARQTNTVIFARESSFLGIIPESKLPVTMIVVNY